ncbi:uncharacterized protein LOC125941000 [Dermacentor silvarum]|uniref:uncharacterized protein LOC125941000 n=1 Tax=Dermacentor silvarum TaxID=543639 RepID=UPI002101824B|nr:uncharacterized protein LOC125941000 [Dermacentor silvarum]
MCLCETSFEVTLLSVFCLLMNVMTFTLGLNVANELQHISAITMLYLYVIGASAVLSVVLIIGTMSGSKKFVNLFVLGAMLRVVYFCIQLGYFTFEYYTVDTKKFDYDDNMIHIYALRFLQRWLGERPPNAEEKAEFLRVVLRCLITATVVSIVGDSFVIYRIRVFFDRMADRTADRMWKAEEW